MQSANWIAVGVIIISTILNAGYFLPIVFRAFFREAPAGHGRSNGEAPWPILLALIATAAGTVLLFLMPDTASPGEDDDWTVMHGRPLAHARKHDQTTVGRVRDHTRVIVLLDLVIDHHAYFGLDGTFGFGAWFGFVSCVVLIAARRDWDQSSSARILTMTLVPSRPPWR